MKGHVTLYHGTSSKRLAGILKEGILPRSETQLGNFQGSIESRKGFVYLSDAFPIFYASNAADADQSDGMVVLQVSVPMRSLYPDEDFIGQSFTKRQLDEVRARNYLRSLKGSH